MRQCPSSSLSHSHSMREEPSAPPHRTSTRSRTALFNPNASRHRMAMACCINGERMEVLNVTTALALVKFLVFLNFSSCVWDVADASGIFPKLRNPPDIGVNPARRRFLQVRAYASGEIRIRRCRLAIDVTAFAQRFKRNRRVESSGVIGILIPVAVQQPPKAEGGIAARRPCVIDDANAATVGERVVPLRLC